MLSLSLSICLSETLSVSDVDCIRLSVSVYLSLSASLIPLSLSVSDSLSVSVYLGINLQSDCEGMMQVFALNGRMDEALATAGSPTTPLYGYMVMNKGEPSATLWETWYADQLVDDQDDPSQNHIMLGTISAFFWKHLVGVTMA